MPVIELTQVALTAVIDSVRRLLVYWRLEPRQQPSLAPFYDDFVPQRTNFYGPYCYYGGIGGLQANRVFSHQSRKITWLQSIGGPLDALDCTTVEASNARTGGIAVIYLPPGTKDHLPTIMIGSRVGSRRHTVGTTANEPSLKQGEEAKEALVRVHGEVEWLSQSCGCDILDIWACVLTLLVGAEVSDEDWLRVQSVQCRRISGCGIRPLFQEFIEKSPDKTNE